MRIALTLAVVAALGLVSVAEACPASYVHGLGTSNLSSNTNSRAGQVADGYMSNRGVNPTSPVGQTIRPYVAGTAVYEDRVNNIDLDDPIDRIVDQALGVNAGRPATERDDTGGHGRLATDEHFDRHFGNGIHEAGGVPEEEDPVVMTDKRGG